jgi:hypothetical protein
MGPFLLEKGFSVTPPPSLVIVLIKKIITGRA